MTATNIMEFTTGLTAAASAGKLPTTQQGNALVDWLLKSPLLQLEASAAGSGGRLSEHGTAVLRDLREILEAYQAAAVEKNGDDILQNALYALARAGSRGVTERGEGERRQSEATADASDFIGALSVAGEALMGFSWRSETAHLTRLTGADIAEAVEKTAADTKDHLREQDTQMREREDDMDTTGQDVDMRQTFEQRMDYAKETGSQAIGAGQTVKGRAGDVRESAVSRLDDMTYRIAEHAQNDPDYRRAIDTLFSIYDKYKNRAIDRAQHAQQAQQPGGQSVEDELSDILGGGETPDAIKRLRLLVERFAGGKSLQDVFTALAACGADMREDPDARRVLDDWEAFIRKSMDEPGYIESDEYRERRKELRAQWQQLQSRESDVGRKWNTDLDRLRTTTREFKEAVKEDGSIKRLKDAHVALAKHLASVAPTTGAFALGQASWVWSDLTDVVLPRVFAMMKEIPLPRTEYVDADTEFVLENLNLESLQILPGRIQIINQASVNIDAPGPSAGESTKDFSNKTRIKFTGVQLTLNDVSFYYNDKTASLLPKTVTGLLDVSVPEKGVDVDIQVAMLPTQSGTKQREKRGAFHRIEHVSVSLDDVTTTLKDTNHPVATTLFKPIVRARLVRTIRTSLEEYIRLALESLDGLAWDVHTRAQVFADAGAPTTIGTYMLGLTSALGRMAREEGGLRLFAGLQPTSVGLVKDDPQSDKAFAVGAEPQIIDGGKHGPIKTAARDMSQQAKDTMQRVQGEGVPVEMESFVKAVARKRDMEMKNEGWRSAAFDLPTVQHA